MALIEKLNQHGMPIAMRQECDMADYADGCHSTGGTLLLRSIFGGVIFGTTANIIMLISGYSFWVGLLCHSVFGAFGMALVLSLSLVTKLPTGGFSLNGTAAQMKRVAVAMSGRSRG